MKEYLEEIFDIEKHDGFTFTPLESETMCATEIKAFNYVEKGDIVPGTDMGNKYHVVLYRESDDGISHQDHFIPILGDPAHYGARLIENGWFGMISRYTTTSEKYIKPIYDLLISTPNPDIVEE